MISVVERIRAAAVDPELRAEAAALWRTASQTIFDPHDERDGLRASDAGRCVRDLWFEIHEGKKPFAPDVQLFNLDEGSMTGCWMACLLAASLKRDGYLPELEIEVTHDGIPGHIDLYYRAAWFHGGTQVEEGVVEFKKTFWGSGLTAPDVPNRAGDDKAYQIIQAVKYAMAKGCEDACVVTIGPATTANSKPPDKMREDWYKVSEWRERVEAEYARLARALEDEAPECDVPTKWRHRDCPPVSEDSLVAQLEGSLK